MSQASILPLPVVEIINNQPATTSLQVAECFGKNHKEVMRDIRALTDSCPQDFNERNFALVDYTDAKGEKRPMYVVFFDGFMLLVMGYTGKKALQMKLAYIEAFNAMREKLEAGSYAQPPSLPDWFRPLDEDDTAGYLVSKKFRPIFLTFSKNCGVVSLTEPEKLLRDRRHCCLSMAFLLPKFRV